MTLWTLLAIVGAGLALAAFLVLCVVLLWSRGAPHYWEE